MLQNLYKNNWTDGLKQTKNDVHSKTNEDIME